MSKSNPRTPMQTFRRMLLLFGLAAFAAIALIILKAAHDFGAAHNALRDERPLSRNMQQLLKDTETR